MVAVGEGDHIRAPGDLAREFQRRLDGIGAGRSRELYPVIEPPRLKDMGDEGLEEGGLCHREEVETVGDPVARDVIDQRLLHVRVIVPVVQGGTAGQEIDELPA